MDSRKNFCYLLMGTNGTGKSSFLIQILKQIISGNKRALILNPSEEEKWEQFPIAKMDELPTFTGIRQLKPDDDFRITDYIRYMRLLEKVYKYYENGILIIDDAKVFLGNNLQSQMTQMMIKRRQKNIDMFLVFHSIGQVPPSLFPYSTHIVLFKTNENRNKWVNKFPIEGFENVVNRVNAGAESNPYHNEVIKL